MPRMTETVIFKEGDIALQGILALHPNAKSLIIFAHGSGSGRLSPRNQFVAFALQEAGLATLLIDLLTEEESEDRNFVFDIPLLAKRLTLAKTQVCKRPDCANLNIGYFGASTGAGAAILAAVNDPDKLYALVSRGGRPDLAGDEALSTLKIPTLLIVGGNDSIVIDLNQKALEKMQCEKTLEIVPRATHLFEEAGTLEQVAELAIKWFIQYQ